MTPTFVHDSDAMRMKIEYLPEGAAECPLVRLYGLDLRSFVDLREITRHLGNSSNRSYDLNCRRGFHLVNLNSFTLNNFGNMGTTFRNGIFTWELQRSQWHVVSMLIEPFIDEPVDGNSYQWLSGPDAVDPLCTGDIAVLLSHSREGVW